MSVDRRILFESGEESYYIITGSKTVTSNTSIKTYTITIPDLQSTDQVVYGELYSEDAFAALGTSTVAGGAFAMSALCRQIIPSNLLQTHSSGTWGFSGVYYGSLIGTEFASTYDKANNYGAVFKKNSDTVIGLAATQERKIIKNFTYNYLFLVKKGE